MSGPLTQFSLFDLPAPQDDPAGAQPDVTPEAALPDPAFAAMPEVPVPPTLQQAENSIYIENQDAGTPALQQEQPQPEKPEEAGVPLPAEQQFVPNEPIASPEVPLANTTETKTAVPASPLVAFIDTDTTPAAELPAEEATPAVDQLIAETAPEPEQPTAAVQPHFAELQAEPVGDAADVPTPPVDPALTSTLEPAQEEPAPVSPTLIPQVAQQSIPSETVPAPVESRPTRPIVAFDIEPLGAADPQDIPREFLSGRPMVKEPKPKSNRGRKSLKPTEAGPDKILVPEDKELFKKQYYGISEVAEMFGVNISQIRYWENEFPQLKPRKNGKGDRLFRPEDVKMLVLIHDLIRRRKYTLEGAKEFLRLNNDEDLRFPMIQHLQKLKIFLNELKANM